MHELRAAALRVLDERRELGRMTGLRDRAERGGRVLGIVPEDAVLGPDVSEVRFPAMRVAECGMKGPIELEMRLIDWLYRTWLSASGFAPDAQPAFEAWDGRPFAHAPAHFELRFHLPVVDAAAPI